MTEKKTTTKWTSGETPDRVIVLKIAGTNDVEEDEKKQSKMHWRLPLKKASSGWFTLVHSRLGFIAPANKEQKIGTEIIKRSFNVLPMSTAKSAGIEGLLIVEKFMQSSSEAGYTQCWVAFRIWWKKESPT